MKGQMINGSAKDIEGFFKCRDGHLAIAAAVAGKLKGQPLIVVWYVVGVNLVRLYLPGLSSVQAQICGGGFVAALSSVYTSDARNQLVDFAMRGEQNTELLPLAAGNSRERISTSCEY